MFKSPLFLVLILAAVTAVSIGLSGNDSWPKNTPSWKKAFGDEGLRGTSKRITDYLTFWKSDSAGATNASASTQQQTGSSGAATYYPIPLDSIFQFDATPSWVMQNWPRVSTQTTADGYTVMRVTLVTGTSIHDVAGSLTYYFDTSNHVQRVAFDGSTGDASQLVRIATEKFKLRRGERSTAGLYYASWNGRPHSALRVQPAAVVRSEKPLERFHVTIELNRPGSLPLSDPQFAILTSPSSAS